MRVRIGVNGLGRVGRALLLAAAERPGIEVVAVNDVAGPAPLVVAGRRVRVSALADPADLPWAAERVDVAVDCTGHFASREGAARHLMAGAHRVVVAGHGGRVDATLAMGINERTFDPVRHRMVSAGSCTSHAAAILTLVLAGRWGIRHAFVTTVGDPDGTVPPTRRRVAPLRPEGTELLEMLPVLDGRVDTATAGVAVAGSAVLVLVAKVGQDTSVSEVNRDLARAATHGPLAGLLRCSCEPLGAGDLDREVASCVVSLPLTRVDGSLVQLVARSGGAWSYAHRLADLADLVGRRAHGAAVIATGP